MTIIANTFVFLISFILIIYLALKFRYFREKREEIQKRKFKNIFDVTITLSILIFSTLHVNSFINSVLTGEQAESYMRYILLSLGVYFIWMFVNVQLYRKELKVLEQTKVRK